VDEDIVALFAGDETEALLSVEELHRACDHLILFSCDGRTRVAPSVNDRRYRLPRQSTPRSRSTPCREPLVERIIDGFHQDDHGEWVAELSCLHGQHVRHRPPFQDRPWVTTADGRAGRVGSAIECPLCDRAELPDALSTVRVAGPFDADTLPMGLRRDHRVADRTWGLVRVLDGRARLTLDTAPVIDRELVAGDAQPIPPGVTHAVHVDGHVRLVVEFLTRTRG
jgi:hypothetical protein